MQGSNRRYELDWLRVTAILLVFLFHSARFFDTADWHVKSPVTFPQLDVAAVFVVSWMMPLIFVVSGASVFYASGKGSSGGLLRGKVLRLLVPLVAGAFSHLALQVYLERLTHRQFYGSFWAFLPHYFEGIYGLGGNFAITGMHLWYLWVLFLFTLLLAPLFLWLRRGAGQRVLQAVGGFLAVPGAMYLLAVPVYLGLNWLDPNKGIGAFQQGGWVVALYILFYLGGFVIYAHAGLRERVRQLRWLSLALGIACVALLVPTLAGTGVPLWGTRSYRLLSTLFALSSWAWLLAFLGFFQQHLNIPAPFLSYANEAVLPFYILHQSVILCVGFFLLPLGLSPWPAYLLIASVSLGVTLLLYEFLIRRHNVTRFLFGMKPLAEPVPAPRPEPAA